VQEILSGGQQEPLQKKLNIALSHAQQMRADEEFKRDQLL
jgi:hypothetical protein